MDAEKDNTATANECERETAISNNTMLMFYKIYKILK